MTSRTSPDEFIPPYNNTDGMDDDDDSHLFFLYLFLFPLLFAVVFINFSFRFFSPDRVVGLPAPTVQSLGRRRSEKRRTERNGGPTLTRLPFSRRRVGYQVEEKRHTHTPTEKENCQPLRLKVLQTNGKEK
jgi:hypothetical protein